MQTSDANHGVTLPSFAKEHLAQKRQKQPRRQKDLSS